MKQLELLLGFSISSACASQSGVQKQELERGVFQLDCPAPLGRCSEEADKTCDGRGYDVVEGYDQRKLYGHAAGQSQVEGRTSRLVVSCRGPRGESKVPTTAPATTTPRAARPLLCTPGATQRCVGAGACDGGQSCLADGSGYGACDCGKVAPAAPASPTPVP